MAPEPIYRRARGGAPWSSGLISNAGKIEKTGGTATSAIAPQIVNDGTISSTSGTLDLQNQLTGTGTDKVGSGATLEVDNTVGSGQTFDYASGGGEFMLDDLDLGGKSAFSGVINDFGAGDSFYALDFGTGATFKYVPDSTTHNTGGALELTDGTLHANIAFTGAYTTGSFTANTSGSGTLFTFHA